MAWVRQRRARRRSSIVAGRNSNGFATRRRPTAPGTAAFSRIASRPLAPGNSVGLPARLRLSQPGVSPYSGGRRSAGSWRRAMASSEGVIRDVIAARPRSVRSPRVSCRTVSARRSISGRGVEEAAMATPTTASAAGTAAAARRAVLRSLVQGRAIHAPCAVAPWPRLCPASAALFRRKSAVLPLTSTAAEGRAEHPRKLLVSGQTLRHQVGRRLIARLVGGRECFADGGDERLVVLEQLLQHLGRLAFRVAILDGGQVAEGGVALRRQNPEGADTFSDVVQRRPDVPVLLLQQI